MLHGWAALVLVFGLLGFQSPAPAYIDSPPETLTLPKVVLEFRSIQVLQVEKLDLARGAVLFKSIERIQGREDAAVLKHSVKFGEGVPAELKGLKPGQLAVHFSGDGYKRTITLVEGAWYCSNHDTRTGWSHIAYTAGHYDFNCAFTGTVPELKETIRQLLRGEEAVMRCRKKAQKPETQFVRCTLRQPNKKEVVLEQPKPDPKARIVKSDKPSVPALVQQLKDAGVAARVEAAESLAGLGLGAKDATAPLAALLRQDKDPFVRRAAAVALGSIGSDAKAAVPELLAALQSHYENVDGLVGSECAVAIGKIDPEGKQLAPLLTAKLKDPSADTRYRAAGWAAIIGPPARSVTSVLIEAAKDKSGEVRHSATAALGSIRPDVKVSVPVFITALKDSNKFVRMAAARALGEIGPEAKDAIPALKAAVKDSDGEVRQYAEEALKQVTAP
jgi:hypothetical protein